MSMHRIQAGGPCRAFSRAAFLVLFAAGAAGSEPRSLASAASSSLAVSTAPQGGNSSPAAPLITEPATDGLTLNPVDVHMETAAVSDPDPGDQHACTDWEIRTVANPQRVWASLCATGVERLHAHLGDGIFEGSHAGRSELLPNKDYLLLARHSDDSGDPATAWSPWSQRAFRTGTATQVFALELQDVSAVPSARWRFASDGAGVVLEPASSNPLLLLESGSSALFLSIEPNDGVTNALVNPAPLAAHVPVRVQLQGGSLGLTLPDTDLSFVDDDCETHTILLPAVAVAPGAASTFWVSTAGASYAGDASETTPSFATLARGLTPPWDARQDGFQVEVFAEGFQLPVNIAFVPNAGSGPGDPFLYVTELYGKIRVVTRDHGVGDYASDLLDFSPTGAFPGSGEQGVSGIAVDPASGDVFAALLYAAPGNPSVHFPRIDRFASVDGGRTAATRTAILDMPNEIQGQSHQISNLTLAPDGTLLCHMGDGFTTGTALDLESFRGKILRLNLDGSPAPTNPFYDAGDGITARDYVFAYGVRNPFGGDWRAADGKPYVVENGPNTDRFAQVVAGRNFGWNGTNATMTNFALYNWTPSHAPVNLAFVQSSTFGGSGFPASSLGHAFVSESGPTYGTGPQVRGKRITEWILDDGGALVAGPIPFLEYAGDGKATACALEAGPDGLYMSELYFDQGTDATEAGARILRVYFESAEDCNANDVGDACDIASGTSADVNASWTPDECDCAGASYCTAKTNSLGCVPAIGSSGSATAGAPDDFVVSGSNVLNNKPGIAIWNTAPAAVPFAGGTRCVKSPVRRMPLMNSGGSPAGSDCSGVFSQPVSDLYMSLRGLTAGTTAYFQIWSRDPGFASPHDASLTDALRVLVCP